MTRKQRKLINEILKAAKLITQRLGDGEGNHCAVGELLCHTGVKEHCLAQRRGPGGEEYSVLHNKYGLEPGWVQNIMATNDRNSDERRTVEVLTYINSLPVEDGCESETESSQ